MDRTLAVFGCSFTDYPQWPSWADWLGNSYSSYIKLARGGTGIRAQFNTLVNFINSKTEEELSKIDIVVQWSSLNRVDFMLENNKTDYMRGGSAFNNAYTDSDFIKKYYSSYQQVYESINYISSAKILLRNKKIRYAMTFMLDPRVGSFLGEPGFNIRYESISYAEINKLKVLLQKFNNIIDGNFTDKCITFHQLDNPNRETIYSYEGPEGHPSPMQHHSFMKEHIAPFFKGVSINESSEIDKCIEDWQIYAEIEANHKNKNHLEPNRWPVSKRYNGKEIIQEYNIKENYLYKK